MQFSYEQISRAGEYGAIALASRAAQRTLPIIVEHKEIFIQLDKALVQIQNFTSKNEELRHSLFEELNNAASHSNKRVQEVASIVRKVMRSAESLILAEHMPVGASGAAMHYGGASKLEAIEAIDQVLKVVDRSKEIISTRIAEDYNKLITEKNLTGWNKVPSSFFEFKTEFLGRDNNDFRNEIIQSASFFDSLLIKRYSNNPQALLKLTPRQFEELVAELWSKFGWNVELTAKTRDGGRDIIAIRSNPVQHKILIECKRMSDSVGVGIVRELHGVVEDEKANKGVIVTTSWFSKEAKRYLERNQWRLSGTDFIGLNSWLRDYQYWEMSKDLGIYLHSG